MPIGKTFMVVCFLLAFCTLLLSEYVWARHPQKTRETHSVTRSQETRPSFPDFKWSRSLPVDSQSHVVGKFGGTEGRSLVSMGGKIYAGIGYSEDSETKDAKLPGAQVLVLDSSESPWRVDLQLDERIVNGPDAGIRKYKGISALNVVTFHYDMNGSVIAPTSVLLAGVWKRDSNRGTEVFYRTEMSNDWQQSVVAAKNLAPHPARSFFLYRDKITGVEKVFVGTRVPDGDQPGGIYTGGFDSARHKIRWDPNPEAWKDHPDTGATVAKIRVSSFAECNGKLYATAYDSLYERQDGTPPVWIRVFQHPMAGSNTKGGTGFRGLTAIGNPATHRQVLLVAQEGRPFLILRIDPFDGFRFRVDLNVSQFLGQLWNETVGYGVAAYNDMIEYPESNNPYTNALLIGFEAVLPRRPAGPFYQMETRAHFLVRHFDGTYELREIVDSTLQPSPILVSTRELLLSPFPDDPVGSLYASGFDTNSRRVHNTAWIYKGVPISK